MKRTGGTTKFRKWINKNSTAGVVFAMPFILGFTLFMVVPMAMSLYYSFCRFEILGKPQLIGFDNYIKMFTADPDFYKSLKVTFFYAFVSVPLKLIFALMVALILLKNTKMSGFYRAAYYLPSIIGGSVAISILWKRLFAEDGTVNRLLQLIGIDSHFSWLGNKHTAIWVLIILAIWQFGSSMLVFLSALKQIPASLYEAAKVDGAGAWKCFTRMTCPNLLPSLFTIVVLSLLNGFKVFREAYLVAGDYPQENMYLLQHLFNNWYRDLAMDKMAAAAVVTGIAIMVLVLLLQKAWERED